MESYSQFSLFYDRLMSDVDYKARAAHLIKLFKKYGKTPPLLLDLACGTGGFSNEMARHGIEVIGVDMSEEMLAAARENSADMGTDVLFLCQKAEDLNLYGTVDGAICCLDSVNHITNAKDLKTAFSKVSLFLEKDCLFIFDANTIYKHREVLGNNTFVIEQEDLYCVWQNCFDEENLVTHISLDFFEENGEFYERYCEDFDERAYSDEELTAMLEDCGFSVEAILGDMTDCEPTEFCERKIFVAKKIK